GEHRHLPQDFQHVRCAHPDGSIPRAPTERLLVLVGGLGGGLELGVHLLEELLGLLRVPAEIVLVGLLRGDALVVRLGDELLRGGEVGVLLGAHVHGRAALRERGRGGGEEGGTEQGGDQQSLHRLLPPLQFGYADGATDGPGRTSEKYRRKSAEKFFRSTASGASVPSGRLPFPRAARPRSACRGPPISTCRTRSAPRCSRP